MAEHPNFFLPSTAWGGARHRLGPPRHDPLDTAQAFADPFVSSAEELQATIRLLEPMLVTLYCAGYLVPEVVVFANGGSTSLSFDTATSRIGPVDAQLTAPNSDDAAPAAGMANGLLLRCAKIQRAGGTIAATDLTPLATQPGFAHTWFEPADATAALDHCWLQLPFSTASTRSEGHVELRDGVVATCDALIPLIDTSSPLSTVYSWGSWALPTTPEFPDVRVAAAAVAERLETADPANDLRRDLGLDTTPDESRPYPTTSLRNALKNAGIDPSPFQFAVPSVDDLLTALLKSQPVEIPGMIPRDHSSMPWVAAIFDLESAGMLDVVGPIVTGPAVDLAAVQAVLDVDGAIRLSDAQLGVLATHLRAGPGPLAFPAAGRLVAEHPHITDPAVNGDVVSALVSVTKRAEPDPDFGFGPLAPDTFEAYLAELATILRAHPDDPDIGAAMSQSVHDLWFADPQPDQTPQIMFGSVILFSRSEADAVRAPVVMNAAEYYAVHLHVGWRGDMIDPSTVPPLGPDVTGWSEDVFALLCEAAESIGRTQGSIPGFDSSRLESALSTLAGISPLSSIDPDAIEQDFAQRLEDAISADSVAEPLRRYGVLMAAVDEHGRDESFARRLRLDKLLGGIKELIDAESIITSTIDELHADAAVAHVGGSVDLLVEAEVAWLTSPGIEAYLATLDIDARNEFEGRELDALGSLSREAASAVMAELVVARLSWNTDALFTESGLDALETALLDVIDPAPTGDFGASQARNVAKGLRAGSKIPATVLLKPALARLTAGTTDAAIKEAARSVARGDLTRTDYRNFGTAIKRTEGEIATLGQVGNVFAVMAMLAAMQQLEDEGWDGVDIGTIGLARDVATGATALPLMAAPLLGYYSRNLAAGATLLGKSAGLYVGIASPFISILTNGVAAMTAWENGDYVAATLYGFAAGANVVVAGVWAYSSFMAGTLLASSALPPFAIVLAIAATVAAVFASLWIWYNSWAERAAFEQELEDSGYLYSDTIDVYPPVTMDHVVGVHTDNLMFRGDVLFRGRVRAESDPRPPTLPVWSVVNVSALVSHVDGVTDEIVQPLPGSVRWLPGMASSNGEPPSMPSFGSDVHWSETPVEVAWSMMFRMHVKLETWLKPSGPGTVLASVEPGLEVVAGYEVATIALADGSVESLVANGPGRVIRTLPDGAAVTADDAVVRIRHADQELMPT